MFPSKSLILAAFLFYRCKFLSQADQAKKRYMPGIDGLRAISVLAVIAYHLDLKCAQGRTRTCTDCRKGQEHGPITD
ncbi:hypothetical protein BK126_25235 [Paenibacillus sp. FSL H7-0326]|nr:hypothetical protein BK126_25235 [Paenibacillus sp. FSL H7-0326]